MWTKIKQKLNKFKKWLIALFIGGTAIATVGMVNLNGAIPVDCIRDTTKQIHQRISDCSIPGNELATYKGEEIAKQVTNIVRTNVKFSGADYDIEILETKAIKDGIEVLARAWTPDGKQVGFGKDGTVDIERFIIINPPILVDDPNGDVVRQWNDKETGKLKQRKLKEDPKEAILQSLAHTIKVKSQKFGDEKIVKGKIGNTTLTAYPNAGTGTAPIDGNVSIANQNAAFSTVRAGTGDSADNVSGTEILSSVRTSATQDRFFGVLRSLFGFDTSIIGSGTIVDSGTFSLYITAVSNGLGSQNEDLVKGKVPADETALASGDFVATGWDFTRLATGIDIPTMSLNAYSDWALNVTGKAHINKTGRTWFGSTAQWDTDNSFGGAWDSLTHTRPTGNYADVAGTATDPKLVVEYTAGVVARFKIISGRLVITGGRIIIQ